MSRVRKVAGVGASLLAFVYIAMPSNKVPSNKDGTYTIENGEHAGKKIPAGSFQAKVDARISKMVKYRRDHPRK